MEEDEPKDTQKILSELEVLRGRRFPRQALKEAIANPDQILPDLLNILDYSIQNHEILLDQPDCMAYMYREEHTYPKLVKFFSLPGEVCMELGGDIVTEDLHRITDR